MSNKTIKDLEKEIENNQQTIERLTNRNKYLTTRITTLITPTISEAENNARINKELASGRWKLYSKTCDLTSNI